MKSKMTKQFVKKNIELSLDFESFLAKNPKVYDSIPNGAVIIFTVQSDDEFNQVSFQVVKHYPKDHPIVAAEKHDSIWVLNQFQPQAA